MQGGIYRERFAADPALARAVKSHRRVSELES
jgi:hypothetical protein